MRAGSPYARLMLYSERHLRLYSVWENGHFRTGNLSTVAPRIRHRTSFRALPRLHATAELKVSCGPTARLKTPGLAFE